MISPKMLEKFKKIYFEEFKVKLSNEEATRQATDLLNIMKIITRPLPKSEDTK